MFALFSVFLFSFAPISFALDTNQPLAGDSRGCGDLNRPCTIADIFTILVKELKDFFLYFIMLTTMFAVLVFGVLFAQGYWSKDHPGALANIKEKAWQVVFSLILLTCFVSVLGVFLKAILNEEYFNMFKLLFSRLNDGGFFIQNAFAASQGGIPNIVKVNNLFDLVVLIYSLTMRWILIPTLIVAWIWSGFLFIFARGNPKKLEHAKEMLLYSVIWTFALLVVLGFVYSLRSTFTQVIS